MYMELDVRDIVGPGPVPVPSSSNTLLGLGCGGSGGLEENKEVEATKSGPRGVTVSVEKEELIMIDVEIVHNDESGTRLC